MPDSITVAAFVIGLALVIAAFVGKELKVANVERINCGFAPTRPRF